MLHELSCTALHRWVLTPQRNGHGAPCSQLPGLQCNSLQKPVLRTEGSQELGCAGRREGAWEGDADPGVHRERVVFCRRCSWG